MICVHAEVNLVSKIVSVLSSRSGKSLVLVCVCMLFFKLQPICKKEMVAR